MFARLKHDTVLRQGIGGVYAETVTFQDRPSGTSKGQAVPVTQEWRLFYQGSNSVDGFKWMFAPHTMLVNGDYPKGKEKVELISCGGNVVSIIETNNTHGHVLAFGYDSTPPAYRMNYSNFPFLIQKATARRLSDGAVLNVARGLDAYFPLLYLREMWVRLDKVELFPKIGEFTVKALPWMTVRAGPGREFTPVGGKVFGQKIVIKDYCPRGSDVWAEIDGGWVCLLYNGWELTSWHMYTKPPVPPKLSIYENPS